MFLKLLESAKNGVKMIEKIFQQLIMLPSVIRICLLLDWSVGGLIAQVQKLNETQFIEKLKNQKPLLIIFSVFARIFKKGQKLTRARKRRIRLFFSSFFCILHSANLFDNS